ncbi:MAG: signal protein [Betaproteobacteria bacterium SG8_41]|nr:MAG: signal protein [Betaproteobacteria bacterium SG8_41]
MGLRLKFNLILFLVFVMGIGVTGWISNELLQRNARDEIVRNAGLMMEAALAIRGYTVSQIRPHLEMQLMRVFLPQSVPAYAATETINELRKKHPDYSYKEATLNPTNPRNRATDWESDLVQTFRNNPDRKEIMGERDTPTGRSLYIARPIQVKNPACLACHSVPSAAPKSMIKLYGEANGFGWKHDEIVGAQVVSVPMSLPIENANRAFQTFMTLLAAVFAAVFIVLNLMLSWMIVRPIHRMSRAADRVSTGDFEIEEFSERGKDEIAVLGASFNRMRRSLQKAMQMIES